jgi:hypothetical protein
MADPVAGRQHGPLRDPIASLDVQVLDDPTGAFKTVSIEVLDDLAPLRPEDQTVADGHHPLV